MGFLKRLFGQPDPKASAAPEMRVTVAVEYSWDHPRHPTPPFVNRRGAIPPNGVKLRGGNRVDVVGERNYEPALVTVTGGRTEAGVNVGVLAALVPEPTKPKYPKAVAVQVDGATVGHLSRTDARAYRTVVEKLTAEGRVACCNATIRGGWDRGGKDQGDFGVSLDLGPADHVLREG